MRFLFVIQGEGRGHMSQALALSQILKDNGHEICCSLVGKVKNRLIPDYFAENINSPVKTYNAPGFIKSANGKGINLAFTFLTNLLLYKKYKSGISLLNSAINEILPDVVVNFYEPLLGMVYKKYQPAVPHVCISHHFLTGHPDFPLPEKKYFQLMLLKRLNKITSYNANRIFALSFKPVKPFIDKKIIVSPPLIRKRILNIQPSEGDYILGYMLNNGHVADVIKWHGNNKGQKAIFFRDTKHKEETLSNNNIEFNDIDDAKFIEFLGKCRGLITTSGFDLICEAMYLNKPVAMVPTPNHYEQLCNAHDAYKAGAGVILKNYDPLKLIDFIANRDTDSGNNNFKRWADTSEKFYLKKLISTRVT